MSNIVSSSEVVYQQHDYIYHLLCRHQHLIFSIHLTSLGCNFYPTSYPSLKMHLAPQNVSRSLMRQTGNDQFLFTFLTFRASVEKHLNGEWKRKRAQLFDVCGRRSQALLSVNCTCIRCITCMIYSVY